MVWNKLLYVSHKLWKGCLLIVIIIFIWSILDNYSNPLFLPKFETVISTLQELILNGMLFESIKTSFMRITIAILIATGISIPIGLLIANYKIIDNIVTPITNSIRYIPVTVFYPLLIMWLGIDEKMKITFLFLATFFYFLPTVVLIVKDTNKDLIDTAQTMGMNSFQVMLKVLLPYSLPLICESLIMMYGIGWTYVIIVEVVNAHAGLGHIINLGTARGRTDLVFVSIIAILVISKIFDVIGNKLIKKAFKWKYARQISG
jgi:NitT/TauT family transport system permease protein